MSDALHHTGRIRKALSNLVAPKAEQEMQDAETGVRTLGASPIADCDCGAKATVGGILKSVALLPKAGIPSLEADLFDGTGHLRLVFLGRRSIAGIEPGRRMIATGRINKTGDRLTMYNPRYQLLPRAGSD